MVNKVFTATKAFVFYKGKVLILRESTQYQEGTNSGRYDIPGGRIIPGQRYDESLLREVKEETGLEVRIRRPFHVDEWRPKIDGEEWQVVGIFFECLSDSDRVILSRDHDSYSWINPKEHQKFEMIPGLERAFTSFSKLSRK
jgi:8-oxo-dGTP diphosphatase